MVGLAIDALILFIARYLVFGRLFPLIGMPREIIVPVYIGSMVMIVLFSCFSIIDKLVTDLDETRFIDYLQTLALPLPFILLSKIIAAVIEITFISLPQFLLGIALLVEPFEQLYTINWLAVITTHILTCIFFATLLLTFAFTYSRQWFMSNIWPRRLTPILLISSVTFPLSIVWDISPTIWHCMIVNPTTHAVEALRSLIVGSNDLPLMVNYMVLITSCLVLFIISCYKARKRLDAI
jgi:ABC-type polysaccharide/polyol phosphate export permease